ncbi:MAG: hypothetical protein KIT35_07990 [Piscinibacter sp.]|uniref:hypothetical protein n=1 Tax=Piscinibacter TaxID=1114981 RepID=UPI000FDF31E9|nr:MULTISPECIES: hypothetical protein [Piscinibacter]MCW5663760.1 hypothetical protein [Piscinibacter sp.]
MFSDRRRLRRWAAQVLLVWLFGLAMGVANACALGEPAHHRSDVVTTPAADAVQQHQHGNEQGDLAKVNCLDFCEKSSVGVPQLKVAGDDLAALGFALPVLHTLSVSGQAEPAVSRLVVDSPHLPDGPPPRIAFQRLAL